MVLRPSSALGALFVALAASACGSDEPMQSGGSDAGPDVSVAGAGSGGEAGSGGSAGSGASGGTGGTSGSGGLGPNPHAGCDPGYDRDVVPEGWELYTEWSPTLPFYVPTAEQYLPPPIEWIPCSSYADVGVDCRMMRLCWLGSERGGLGLINVLETSATEPPRLFFHRGKGGFDVGYSMPVVAEVDGPVKFAMMDPRVPGEGTLLEPGAMESGRFVLQVRGEGGNAFESGIQGALVGTVGDLKPTLFDKQWGSKFETYEYESIAASYVVRGELPTALRMMPLDGGAPQLIQSGPGVTWPQTAGDVSIFENSGLSGGALFSYEPQAGTRELVNDSAAASYNVGTDGNHIVWTRADAQGRSIMVSPFATEASAIMPRRLKSDPSTSFVPYAVGCGHTGRQVTKTIGALVVRISDGMSWTLPPILGERPWIWSSVIGFTCDEVFLRVDHVPTSAGAAYTIARVRLDSLGPGTPPD